MSNIHTLNLSHLPEALLVHIALYENVKNAAFLHQQLLQGNSDFEYALIDASIILSTTHVLAAVFRAANDYLLERLKSKNVHSEIVFCLSPNNNIAESFRRFGLTPTTASLLAIKLSTQTSITAASVSQHLCASIEGTSLPFNDRELARLADIPRIRKIYKLSEVSKVKGKRRGGSEPRIDVWEVSGDGDEAKERKELEISVLGVMALRGAG